VLAKTNIEEFKRIFGFLAGLHDTLKGLFLNGHEPIVRIRTFELPHPGTGRPSSGSTDLTRGTGHFNLGQGIVGTTVGVGAAVSTTLAGYLSDHYGSTVAFSGLAVIAAAGFAAV
jgi:hypothetical protein